MLTGGNVERFVWSQSSRCASRCYPVSLSGRLRLVECSWPRHPILHYAEEVSHAGTGNTGYHCSGNDGPLLECGGAPPLWLTVARPVAIW